MSTIYTLECGMEFLGEQRSKMYKWYITRAAQVKISFRAKNELQSLALPGLESRGV